MDESESLRHSKCAVSHVVGDIQGKSAIHLARVYGEPKKNFVGQGFWVRGGLRPDRWSRRVVIRENIRDPEQEEKRLDQPSLWR